MASNANWFEQNGVASGTPPQGVETPVYSLDWKSVDDTSTPRASATITAGENSFSKYNYIKFSGTFNEISDVKFLHSAGTAKAGTFLKGKVTSIYETPTRGAIAGATDMTNAILPSEGASVLLSTTGPNDTNPSASQTSACSTQYLVTQLQTTGSAPAGEITSMTLMVHWKEN